MFRLFALGMPTDIRVRLHWMGPWCKPIYFDVSWLVDYLYKDFAEIFPAEKILYAKFICQRRHDRK